MIVQGYYLCKMIVQGYYLCEMIVQRYYLCEKKLEYPEKTQVVS